MPKTKQQCENIKKERRDAILNSALYAFALHGYEAVGIDDIARSVNCSHGLLYHYFKSKEELFRAVMEEVCIINHRKILKDVNRNQKAKFYLQDLLDAYINALKSEITDYASSLYLLLNVHIQGKMVPKPISPEKRRKIFDNIYECIDQGKADGDFCETKTRELTIAIIAMLKGLSYSRIFIDHKKFSPPKSETIMKMVLK